MILTTCIFVNIYQFISTGWITNIVWFQFLPSLLRFIRIPVLASAGFILILILTALFGRVYCSSICPLGTFQDIIYFFRKKIKRVRTTYKSANNAIRYSILVFAALSFVFGSMLIINLLDPYSIYGRFADGTLKHLTFNSNNLINKELESKGVYFLYPIDIKAPKAEPLILTLVFLSVVIGFVIIQGRLWCNIVCPVGSLLSVISKYSLFKLKIDGKTCTECGLCSKSCRAYCIDNDNKYIDMSRCISCYDCIKVCASNSISYSITELNQKNKTSQPVKIDRRFVLLSTVGLVASAGLKIKSRNDEIKMYSAKVDFFNKPPVTPPGSKNYNHFTKNCTACHLCVAACPTNVLQPSFVDYGLSGIFQPKMDYWTNFCNYECLICSQVCPSGAILPVTPEEKKYIQMGKAILDKNECIVYKEDKVCGACSEHCPTKAVNMVPYKKILAPEVTNKYCVGCGACEFACPTKPKKSIYVSANFDHKVAEPNKSKKATLESKPFNPAPQSTTGTKPDSTNLKGTEIKQNLKDRKDTIKPTKEEEDFPF